MVVPSRWVFCMGHYTEYDIKGMQMSDSEGTFQAMNPKYGRFSSEKKPFLAVF